MMVGVFYTFFGALDSIALATYLRGHAPSSLPEWLLYAVPGGVIGLLVDRSVSRGDDNSNRRGRGAFAVCSTVFLFFSLLVNDHALIRLYALDHSTDRKPIWGIGGGAGSVPYEWHLHVRAGSIKHYWSGGRLEFHGENMEIKDGVVLGGKVVYPTLAPWQRIPCFLRQIREWLGITGET